MPTIKEIKDQIEGLQELKPTVRQTSMFGDNHWDSIDAQVEVLTEDLSEDEIYEKNDSEEWADNVKDAAMEARRWLDGEELDDAEDLVDQWQSLVVK
jgi:hypothetical protein